MKIAVCEDEKVFYQELNHAIEEYSHLRGTDICTYYFENGHELLHSDQDYRLVFMDYELGDMNGIETARRLRENNKDITIIFLTGYPHVVFKSFEVNTFRFLVKPLKKPELFHALDAFFSTDDDDAYLSIPAQGETWKIRRTDIIYLEANRKRTVIRTDGQWLESTRNLSWYENELPKEDFLRVHKSYIAALRHIRNHTSSTILFDNGEQALIGRSYLSGFKTGFHHYILRSSKKDW